MFVMSRTDELLQIAQEWSKLAKATLTPAVREACLDQRRRAMQELIDLRWDYHTKRLRSASLRSR